MRIEVLDLFDGHLVIASDFHVRPQLTKKLDEIIGKGVIVIYNEKHETEVRLIRRY